MKLKPPIIIIIDNITGNYESFSVPTEPNAFNSRNLYWCTGNALRWFPNVGHSIILTHTIVIFRYVRLQNYGQDIRNGHLFIVNGKGSFYVLTKNKFIAPGHSCLCPRPVLAWQGWSPLGSLGPWLENTTDGRQSPGPGPRRDVSRCSLTPSQGLSSRPRIRRDGLLELLIHWPKSNVGQLVLDILMSNNER